MPVYHIQSHQAVWVTYFHEVEAENEEDALAIVRAGESEAYDSTIGDSIESYDTDYEIEGGAPAHGDE